MACEMGPKTLTWKGWSPGHAVASVWMIPVLVSWGCQNKLQVGWLLSMEIDSAWFWRPEV